MASLKEIRRRIRSVENVKQITKSMEMIAASRFQKAQMRAVHSNRYIKEMRELLDKVLSLPGEISSEFTQNKKEGRIGLIITSGDKGLCGAYHANLFSEADKFLSEFKGEHVDLILLGKKAIEYYQKKKWPILLTVPDWKGRIPQKSLEELIGMLIYKFRYGNYRSVYMLYTLHETIFSRSLQTIQLLPIPIKKTYAKNDYILEPGLELLIPKLVAFYSKAEFYQMLNHAYASELAARVIAMQTATKNAEEIKESLTLESHKLRQAGITNEMLEISSGAEYAK